MIDRSTIGILDVRYFEPSEPEVDLDLLLESLPDNLRDALSLDSITAMFQQSFAELLQDGEVADVVPEPEPVLLLDHSSPSPDRLVTTVQQAAPAPDAPESIAVPASALFDILDNFITDQHQLAPITSIAGYTDFKQQFDALTGPLVAHQILEPHARDTYFADALHLAPSDRIEIDATLAASYESDQPYAVALVDTTLRQYFQSETGLFLVSPPVYEPDEDGFALRQPPSRPLFDFTVPTHSPTLDAHPSSHAKFDCILDEPIHSGSYENKEAKESAYSHQHVSQHQSSLDIPIIQPYDAATTPSSVDLSLRSLRNDLAPTVWLDLQPSADMLPATVPISASPEVHRSLEAPDPVYVLTVAESTVSPLFEASVPKAKPPLRSLESDLAAAEYFTGELPEYGIPSCPVAACALPPETVVSIAGLSPDRVPVTHLPAISPELSFPPHYVWSPAGEISQSTVPLLPLPFAEPDAAVVKSPPEKPPESPSPPQSSQHHASSPLGLQKLPEVADTARSAAADGVASFSVLFAYAKLQADPFAANTSQHTSQHTSPERSPVAQVIVESVALSSPGSVASIAFTLPDGVPVEPFVAFPPELPTSSPVPHEPAKYDGSQTTTAASEASQHVRVKPDPELVADMVVQDEVHRARSKPSTPHSAMPVLASPQPSPQSHVVRLRASTLRSQRRPPHRLGSRIRLRPSTSRLCHNTPRARTVLAPRVRVPGSDPPCSAIPSRHLTAHVHAALPL